MYGTYFQLLLDSEHVRNLELSELSPRMLSDLVRRDCFAHGS